MLLANAFTPLKVPHSRMFNGQMKLSSAFSQDDNNDISSFGELDKLQVSSPLRWLATGVAAASALLLVSQAAKADDAVAPPAPVPVVLGPSPSDFGLNFKDYYADCQTVVNHMRYAVQVEKGNPVLAEVAQKTKDEMGEFVSYYRRYGGISGKQSFSLLYTSINVLAGHYTSYGVKFPVPEKRRKRLLQEFADIEKNLRKKR